MSDQVLSLVIYIVTVAVATVVVVIVETQHVHLTYATIMQSLVAIAGLMSQAQRILSALQAAQENRSTVGDARVTLTQIQAPTPTPAEIAARPEAPQP